MAARARAKRREDKDREFFAHWIEEMEECTMSMPPPRIVKYHAWGWDKLLPFTGCASWSDYIKYLEAYYSHNAHELVPGTAATMGSSIASLADICLKKEEQLACEWKIRMKAKMDMILPSKSIILNCLIHKCACSVIRKVGCKFSDVSSAALLCIAKEADLMCELLRRGAYPADDYLIVQSSEIRMYALSLMNYTSCYSVAASAAMLVCGWERLVPLHSSVVWSDYSNYLEEYYNLNAFEFVAEAAANQNPEWLMDPAARAVQIATTAGSGLVAVAVAKFCITKEADLMLELLTHGAEPTDDIIQQSSVIRMCALGLVNLKGCQSIASAAAMVGITKEAKMMCEWKKKENKLLTFNMSEPHELEGSPLDRDQNLGCYDQHNAGVFLSFFLGRMAILLCGGCGDTLIDDLSMRLAIGGSSGTSSADEDQSGEEVEVEDLEGEDEEDLEGKGEGEEHDDKDKNDLMAKFDKIVGDAKKMANQIDAEDTISTNAAINENAMADDCSP
uniref:Uncharacterized protein n=1 Tax=Oryza punctata TaxID=4537 RepID=A0A0E0K493_ORYPU